MTAVILALLSSLAYGCADFAGGLAARRAHVLRVVALAAPASLAVEVALVPVLGATWSGSALGWGAASGIASAAAFVLLYRSLAVGPMSVLSPITALVSAALPVALGLVLGETLSAWAIAGLLPAFVAIALVSAAPDDGAARPSRTGLLLAFGAGTAIAAQLICLDQTPSDSGVAPLIAGRAVSTLLVLAVAVAVRRRIGTAKAPVLLAAGAGTLDSLANLAFLLAVRDGQLIVSAVITALYPAATLLLARIVLKERLHAIQLVGLAVAAGAVVLLAIP